MAIYSSGSVTVKPGSAIVIGANTQFRTAVSVGNLFRIPGETVFYTIAAIYSATRLTLTANYDNSSFHSAQNGEYIATVTSATKIYSGQLVLTPLIQNKVVINASGVERFIDDGGGGLVGDASGVGNISYSDGSFSITLGTNPTATTTLVASYYYGGALISSYNIVRDYTPNYNFPEMTNSDLNMPGIYTRAVRLIDSQMSLLEGQTGVWQVQNAASPSGDYITLATPTDRNVSVGASLPVPVQKFEVQGGVKVASNLYVAGDITASGTIYYSGFVASPHTDFDTNAIHDNVSSEFVVIATKLNPVATDLIIIEDSADNHSKKSVKIGNLPFGQGDGAGGAFVKGDLLGSTTYYPASYLLPIVMGATPSMIASIDPNHFILQLYDDATVNTGDENISMYIQRQGHFTLGGTMDNRMVMIYDNSEVTTGGKQYYRSEAIAIDMTYEASYCGFNSMEAMDIDMEIDNTTASAGDMRGIMLTMNGYNADWMPNKEFTGFKAVMTVQPALSTSRLKTYRGADIQMTKGGPDFVVATRMGIRVNFPDNFGHTAHSYMIFGERTNTNQTASDNFGIYLQDVSRNYLEGNLQTTASIFTQRDVTSNSATWGFVTKSPDGTLWRLTVTNAGTVLAATV